MAITYREPSPPLRRSLPWILCAGATLTALATAVSAQTVAPAAGDGDNAAADVTALEVIVVTARKREERGQDVPQSLNVFSGTAMEASGVTALDELQYRVPGLKVTTGIGAAAVSIRGVSNNAHPRGGGPSTAIHYDGVYIPRPAMALGEVFDLERVEVLKGPEGTLYGRNATAGVVNYVTRDPGTDAGFDGFIGGGSFGVIRAQGGADVPLGESAAVRVSAVRARDDGYTENIGTRGGRVDARDYAAVRLKGVFDVGEDKTLKFSLQRIEDDGTIGMGISHDPNTLDAYVTLLNPPMRESPRRIRLDTAPEYPRTGTLFSGTYSTPLGNSIDFKSITGYVEYDTRFSLDGDATGGFIENSRSHDRSTFVSQEFQFAGGEAAAIQWTAGAFASRERNRGGQLITDSLYPDESVTFTFGEQDYRTRSTSAAVFGEITWPLAQRVNLLTGARYTRERMTGSTIGRIINFETFELDPFSGDDRLTSSRLTPKVLLQYRPAEDTMLYASVTTGFKSGGLNLNPPVARYRPEKIRSHEIGAKLQRLGGRLEVEAAAFYYDYTDLQLRTIVGNPPVTPISNVAAATVRGAELSIVARLLRGLWFDVNAAYVDSEMEKFLSPATGTDLSGMPLPLSPERSLTAGVDYRFSVGSGQLSARAEINYQSGVILPALQNIEFEREGPVTLLNANVRYALPGGRTYISVIGRNLTDELYLTNRAYQEGFNDLQTFAAPRTWEVRLGTAF